MTNSQLLGENEEVGFPGKRGGGGGVGGDSGETSSEGEKLEGDGAEARVLEKLQVARVSQLGFHRCAVYNYITELCFSCMAYCGWRFIVTRTDMEL